MRCRWLILTCFVITFMLTINGEASAHANLLRSTPPANAVLDSTPLEIRLWFTEPLEPEFSRFTLHDIETPPSQVDNADSTQLYMLPNNLEDGLYTVIWRVVSSADGHRTEGSFTFTIGDPIAGYATLNSPITPPIPTNSAFIRWLNLLTLAFMIGTIGFTLFVWNPSDLATEPNQEYPLRTLTLIAWMLLGIGSFFILFLQVSISVDTTLLDSITHPALKSVLADTRFGHLWLGRMLLWGVLGITLILTNLNARFYWLSFFICSGILLTHSLNSHASAATISFPAIANDWLHLLAASLWIGGLIQFLTLIPFLKKLSTATEDIARLTGYFSNYARILVLSLILTGLYAAWLEVGSVDGLLETQYGNALLVKLIIILPLIAVAGTNLFLTQKGLNNGQRIWIGRLRRLLVIEITLIISIFATVGVMTAISPARGELAQQAAVPKPPKPTPIVEEQQADGLTITLEISPGWVGENSFSLSITNRSGTPIENASLIRLRFENRDANLGESELRPTNQGGGIYAIQGSNISTPGEWRIRTNIQRPSAYDTVIDFQTELNIAPPPTPAIIPDSSVSLVEQTFIQIPLGLIALISGGWFLGSERQRLVNHLPATGLTAIGIIFLFTAILPPSSSNTDKTLAAEDLPAKLIISTDRPLPYLITQNGTLLRPNANAEWQPTTLDARVNDIYVDLQQNIWAATDSGLFLYDEGQWTTIDGISSTRLVMTHGYLFAMGDGEIVRGPDHWRNLFPPNTDQPASDLVMLSDHSHLLQNGDTLFRTIDLGLSWEPIETPETILEIWSDEEETFFAMSESGIYTWDRTEWTFLLDLPADTLPTTVRSFNGRFYALVDGRLYRQQNDQWELITLPNAPTNLISLDVRRNPATLWVLDHENLTLWSTSNGQNWESTPIIIRSAP